MNRQRPFVLLGGEALLTHRSGIGRMATEVAAHAANHPDLAGLALLMGGQCRPFSPELLSAVCAGPAANPTSEIAHWIGQSATLRAVRNAWRSVRVTRAMRRLRPQDARVVYHETNFIAVPFDGPVSVTVHDLFALTDPQLAPASRRQWIERNLPRVLKDTRAFVCVSNHTAGELKRLFPETAGRIHVVPQGVSSIFHPRSGPDVAPVLDRYGLRDRGYIFVASTVEPRKNYRRLQEAYAGLPATLRAAFPLTIAGGAGWGEDMPAISDGARFLGHVSDQDLAALTARAALYAFVSEKEGFGIPILEAMASDTPLLTSTGSAMEETAGGAALLVEPRDVGAIQEGLRQLLEDSDLRDRLRAAGKLHAAGYSWARTTNALVSIWAEMAQ